MRRAEEADATPWMLLERAPLLPPMETINQTLIVAIKYQALPPSLGHLQLEGPAQQGSSGGQGSSRSLGVSGQ